jgi:hypothetical protein
LDRSVNKLSKSLKKYLKKRSCKAGQCLIETGWSGNGPEVILFSIKKQQRRENEEKILATRNERCIPFTISTEEK